MRFPLLIILSALLILSFTALFEINFLDYSAPVPYFDFRTITFNDFKGFKRPEQTLYGIQEFAFIKTSRKLKLNPGKVLVAITYFHPSRSYVFNQRLRNSDLLTHELYHFHIAEYITRLIRKEIFELKENVTPEVIEKIESNYMNLENEMQMDYDDETDHSYAFRNQKLWEHKIDSSLGSLIKFSDTLLYLQN